MTECNQELLVCTPIDGIKDVLPRLENLFKIIYLPDIEYKDFKKNTFDNVVGIFTNPNRSKIFLSSQIFDDLLNLKFICTASTGTVHIDLEESKKRNIKVISLKNETDFLSKVTSTSELAFTLMMMSIRNIIPSTQDVYNNNWDCDKFIGKQLGDLKIGILGMGRLGKIFSNYCNAFGANVTFYDPYVDQQAAPNSKKIQEIDNFLSDLDVLSIHIHANAENNKFVNKAFLNTCPNNLLIVNTSRGEVVDEKDLVTFLKNHSNSFYATDVISDEINAKDNSPIYSYFKESYPNGNVIITPHIGGMSEGARFLAYNKSVDLLESYLNGEK